MATFGRAPGRELGLFSCSIPPGFVINHNMPTINTTSDWLCSGAFRYTDRRIGKERTGPDRDERFHYFSMAPNWAIGSEKIMLLCIAGGHNLNAALAQPERIAPPTNPTILVVTTPPRERGGFLGDACLSPATLPPTGPVRAGRFRERGSERLTACSYESPPGSVRLCRLRRSGAATLRALYHGLV